LKYDSNNLNKNDEQYTPKYIFDGLGLTFDLDVCAPVGGAPNVPALKHYSIEDDGLTSEWNGLVWMNPPYSKPTPWADKFIEHQNGIALVPVTRGQWFHRLWTLADGILPTIYNMKFDRPGGGQNAITFQTVLVAFGEQSIKALHKLDIGKVR